MSYVHINSESGPGYRLYTVGHYDPKGVWHASSDHSSEAEAAAEVSRLNGGSKAEVENLAMLLRQATLYIAQSHAHEGKCLDSKQIIAARKEWLGKTSAIGTGPYWGPQITFNVTAALDALRLAGKGIDL